MAETPDERMDRVEREIRQSFDQCQICFYQPASDCIVAECPWSGLAQGEAMTKSSTVQQHCQKLTDAYVSLLRIDPASSARARAQLALCLLRDEIADRTDTPAEEVQAHHEELAGSDYAVRVDYNEDRH